MMNSTTGEYVINDMTQQAAIAVEQVVIAAGQVGIIAGGAAVVSGVNKREEAKIHVEALQEISASLDAEIEPHTVNLEESTVTLTGTVNEQYAQWQKVLREIYLAETGGI